MSYGFRYMMLLILILCMWGSSSVFARDALPEYTIKAGFLYNFALLTEWPENHIGKTFNICLYRGGIFATALESIRGKKIGKRPITIRDVETPTAIQTCHLLFLAEITRPEMNRVVKESATKPILTVTDDELLEEEGAMILIRPEGDYLVFKIDHALAKRVNLKLSSRLLRLSR